MRKIRRSIKQWQSCNPESMRAHMSPDAVTVALKDAKHDLLIFHAWASEMQQEIIKFAKDLKNAHTVNGDWDGQELEAELEHIRMMTMAQHPSLVN